MRLHILLIINFLCFQIPSAQSLQQRTYCNPMDFGYRYNFEQLNERISYRSGADPVVVNHRGEYYLFVTISGGWWHSKDLLHWQYVTPDKWPMEDMCAPAALSVRDTLFLFQSTFEKRPIFYSTEPEKGKLKFYNRLLPLMKGGAGPWDPCIFHDDDTDRWFMYFGSSNVYPIYGVELDYAKRLTYKGAAKGMIEQNVKKNGWERFGPNHANDTMRSFPEGAWMTKHNGKYYLQYGAPGTEYNVYANGTYVSDDPLGPFEYAPNNPISYRPGGFMSGAGHGNTFQDNYGNYWNTGTPWVAVNWDFERRCSMFPAGFDKEGLMYSNTRFGDFPHYLPTKKWENRNDLFTGWMLLNYRKPCVASSVRDTFAANRVADDNPRTFWVANSKKNGETLTIDLEKECEVKAFQVNYTDYKSDIFEHDSSVYIQFRMFHSLDGKTWHLMCDLARDKQDRPNAYEELPRPVRARYIQFENVYVPTPNLAVSDIRIFGNGYGVFPKTPTKLSVIRQKDERNADIKWDKVPDAVGYNILWGIAPDKLYQTYQIWGDALNMLELRALTVGQKYYFAIESFNENGVSKLSEVVGGR